MDDPSDTDTGSTGPAGQLAEVLLGGLLKIRGSFLVFVATIGVVFLLLGFVMSESILSGMFGIWGASALVYAGLGFVFLHLIGYR